MKKKTIHAIVKYFYPVAAGIETNMLETYSVLAKKGWDITVHTSKNTLTENQVLPDSEIIRGIKVKRYPYRWYSFWPKFSWSSTSIVNLHNFNISPHLFVYLYSIFLKITGQKKFALVLTPHGGFTPEWSMFPPILGTLKKIYHYTIGTILINLTVDSIRAVSHWERNEIIKKGVNKNIVKTISNGVEDEAYMDLEAKASREINEKVKTYGKYLIQIGRIYDIKNYETTIRALTFVPPDINFVIVGPIGSQKYLKKLEKLIENLNLQKRVFFAGVVRGVDKYYLIKHAQMMVHMAIWESFCNVVHEGMSQGLVPIVANNTALKFLVKNGVNGFRVATTDEEILSEKINYVLNNKDSKIINKMSQTNKDFALQDSWQSVSGKIDTLFKSLTV